MAAALENDMDSSSGHSYSATGTITTVSSVSSSSSSPLAVKEHDLTLLDLSPRLDLELSEVFSENVAAKIWRIAVSHLEQDKALTTYPEFVPSTGEYAGKYVSKPANFWTCGFFPGSMYALLERCMKYPGQLSPKLPKDLFQAQLLQLCRTWSEPLHGMAMRVDTHDLGFIIQPALRMDWELTGNPRSLQSVLVAAESLVSRYDERLSAIRSWDRRINKRESITDKETNFLIIIDSMCNLDLLYYAGHHTSNQKMIDIATSHARVVLQSIVREDYSTFHLINIDPRTGDTKFKGTHQGYSDTSTWSRGQAWAILGFIQTYIWTKDSTFLDAAINLSNYLLARLSSCTHVHPYVPAWDLDAPVPVGGVPLRDTSAGMIAANGFLLLHQILHNNSPYLSAAVKIAKETLDSSLSSDTAAFSVGDHGKVSVQGSKSWDGILMHATANNNEDAIMRYSGPWLGVCGLLFLGIWE